MQSVHRTLLALAILVGSPAIGLADIFDDARRLGRGINLGNALEAPREGDWGMTLQDWHFAEIAEGGFASVRVPIRWSSHADLVAPYAIDGEFFERIDWVLRRAHANNLNVVLNVHHYGQLNEEPSAHRERYLALWQQIAVRYQHEPRSVYFELLNEPNDKLDAPTWNALLNDALSVVRQTNSDRPVIVGPSPWNGARSIDSLQLPSDDQHIIGTFHYYEPFHFTHQGAGWVNDSNAWLGTRWEGTAEQHSAINNTFDAIQAWGKQHNRPIYLGEFGAYRTAHIDDRARWTEFVRRAAESRGFAWSYWEFGAGFGAYNRQEREWIDPLFRALIPNSDDRGGGAIDSAAYLRRDGPRLWFAPAD